MDLQYGPIAKLSTTNYYLTLKTKGTRDSTHATQACTQNTLAMWETTKAHVYQSDTWIYAVPKQSRNRLMALQNMYTKTIS